MSKKLRINRADREASKQTGYPPLFYTIKRTYGDERASAYLRQYQAVQKRPQSRIESVGGVTNA